MLFLINRKKHDITPRNGVFYPRIQSILAYFFGDKKWRKWREVCENICVCEFLTCSRFQHSRRTATAGPPLHVECSSSGHFPPPHVVLYQKHNSL
jgi:hypothetical protein